MVPGKTVEVLVVEKQSDIEEDGRVLHLSGGEEKLLFYLIMFSLK